MAENEQDQAAGGRGEAPEVSPAPEGKKAEPRNTLPHKVQKFIVEQNACDEKPSDVVKAVKEEFGVDVTRQAVERYDPTKAYGAHLRQALVDYYWEVREKYEQQEEKRGIGSISYRLRRLGVLERTAFARGNSLEARECMKQAAEDKGGKYTNRREMTGANGGPIRLTVEEQRKETAAKMLAKLVARGMDEGDARARLVELGVDERDLPALPGS
jgi:hypothetical protein